MLDKSISVSSLTECGVCGHGELETVIDLPLFPLTGIFVSERVSDTPHGHDQKLQFCNACGHAQLENVLAPAFLYGEQYAYRSSASHLTPAAVDFFLDCLNQLRPKKHFKLAVEIGCNEMVLLDRMLERSDRAVGIDPLWQRMTPDEKPGREILGKFLEDVDLEVELGGRPDLIVSTHNLEHINDVRGQLARLMDVAADDALFLMEVPDFDLMVENMRFDQVFHQHIHYFGLTSFLKIIEETGGHYQSHFYNYRGWGGTVVVAFTKSANDAAAPAGRPQTADAVRARYGLYQERMDTTERLLAGLSGEMWGYGAAQMLPTLGYHMKTDFGFLAGIMDDCPRRTGLTYPELDVRIFKPDDNTRLDHATVIITALDAVRPIMNRLRDFNPRFVVIPSHVY